jgi:DNA-directed RNA polymerase subunit beta'
VVDADAELDAAARPMGIQGEFDESADNGIQMLDNEIGINDEEDSEN